MGLTTCDGFRIGEDKGVVGAREGMQEVERFSRARLQAKCVHYRFSFFSFAGYHQASSILHLVS